MKDEKELTGREADANETGRKDEAGFDITKTSSEEATEERGEEERMDADTAREEQEEAE